MSIPKASTSGILCFSCSDGSRTAMLQSEMKCSVGAVVWYDMMGLPRSGYKMDILQVISQGMGWKMLPVNPSLG